MPIYKPFIPRNLSPLDMLIHKNNNISYSYTSVDCGIYILQCEKGKWYIGKAKDIMRRMIQHRFFNKVEWLKLYRPLRIFLIHLYPEEQLTHWENEYTRALVWSKGITNARGGKWTRPDLCKGDNQEELKNFYLQFYNATPRHFGERLI